jgi:DNA-binding NtrC family response regulator
MDNFFQPGPATAAAAGDSEFPRVPLLEATSPSMRAVVTVIRELAHNSVPVLLIGEHGTGKQSIARQIHRNSGGPDLSAACQKELSELLAGQGTNGSARMATRIICGSSRDLEADVRSGSFREDLYYRLSGVCLRIPPLRQRREDIPQLIAFFLERYTSTYRCQFPSLSAATEQLFTEYAWPGNLPQLESAVRAIVAVGSESVAMTGLRSMLTQPDGRTNGEKLSLKETSRAASREAEKELILKVLNRTRWNRRRAAQELQISYKALLYKLKQIGYGEYGAS